VPSHPPDGVFVAYFIPLKYNDINTFIILLLELRQKLRIQSPNLFTPQIP
jgi:hypothetical protein